MAKPTPRANVVGVLMTGLSSWTFEIWKDRPLVNRAQIPKGRLPGWCPTPKTMLKVTAFAEEEVEANRPRTSQTDLPFWTYERLVEVGSQVRELEIGEIGG